MGDQYGGPATAINLKGGKTPEWVELIPAGVFTGRDGRGPFENADPNAIIKATKKLNMTAGLPVDYDHATDYAAPNGGPAPASGWIRDLAVRSGAIWGRVEWTPDGSVHVKNKHWAYLSPVFEYVERNGRLVITCLLRAALTNNPNLELQAIAASRQGRSTASGQTIDDLIEEIVATHSQAKEIHMADDNRPTDGDEDDEAMAAEAASMLSENAKCENKCSDAEMAQKILARVKQRREEKAAAAAQAAEAAAAQAAEAAAAQAAEAAAAQAAAQAATPGDPVTTLSRLFPHLSAEKIAQLAKHATTTDTPASATTDAAVMSLSTELNALKVERAKEKATLAVDDAIKSFRLSPAQRQWGIEYASRDLAGFQAFTAKQPTIVGPESNATGDPSKTSKPAATGAVRAICASLGIDTEKFVEYNEKNKTNRVSMAFDPTAK
jgi:phage I-like protein